MHLLVRRHLTLLQQGSKERGRLSRMQIGANSKNIDIHEIIVWSLVKQAMGYVPSAL
jgi:hypothetical protein